MTRLTTRILLAATLTAAAQPTPLATLAQPAPTPAPTVPAQPHTWKSVIIKANGFINGVVYHPHPAAQGLVYINTDMGGAYRLEATGPDAGRWVCLTDWVTHDDWSLNQMGVETLAVDPTDPDRVYIAMGTYMGPSAVLRSSDRGRTLARTNVPFPMDGNGSARNSGQRMNVDPNLPSRLLYGTRNLGLWTSADHAETWSRINAFPATGETQGPTRNAGLVFTLFDKASGSPGKPTPIAYVGVCTLQPDKLFRTTDAGRSWHPLPGQPTGTDNRLLPTRAALTPDGQTLYVTYVTANDYPGPHGVNGGTLYRIDNPASDSPTYTPIPPTGNGTANYGFSGIALDPTNPSTLYVSTLHRYGMPGDDIYRSIDRGATWTPLHINTHRDDSSAPYVKDFGMHWVGDVQVSPHNPDEAYFTTGWGLYRTTNLTAPQPIWAFYNEGFEQSAVLELHSPRQGPAHLLSVIGDRDGFRHENLDQTPALGRFGQINAAGQTQNLSIGTTNDLGIAWDQPDRVVRVGREPQFSNDGGKTWARFPAPSPDITPLPAPPNAPQRPNAPAPRPTSGYVAISHDGNHVIWAPNRFPLLHTQRTPDGWTPWTPATGLPTAPVTNLVTDLGQPNTFYARAGRTLLASSDHGQSWSIVTDALPDRPGRIRAVHNHPGHLVLPAGENGTGGLHHSTDGGRTWTPLAPDTIVAAKHVGVGAPATPGGYPALFINGTLRSGESLLRGYFRSDDAGQSWVHLNDDQHHFGNIIVLNGDTRLHGRLYIGTNGRGILYADPIQ